MGLFDRSSSTNTTNLTEQTVTETQQQDQSGNSGLNFANVGGGLGLSFSSNETLNSSDSHNSSTTDQGAVAAGRDLGLGALDASSKLANTSLSTLAKQNSDSLALFSGLVDKTLDNSKTAMRDASASSQDFLDQALAGFKGLAVQSSQSSDDRITKLVAYGLVAIVLLVVAPAIFKSGSKAVIA